MKKPGVLVSFISLCLFVAMLGGLVIRHPLNDWYPTLIKPYWRPPESLFGPGGILLYVLMAIAAWRLFLKKHPARKKALFLFFLQLLVNLAWPFLFFGLHSPLLGLLDIILLLFLLIWTIKTFAKIEGASAWLLSPYLLGVFYITLLNASIWHANR